MKITLLCLLSFTTLAANTQAVFEFTKAANRFTHGIAQSMFYKWNKEFLEAGKKRLSGDVTREATSEEVADLRIENQMLKEMVAGLILRYDIVKKSSGCLE